MLSTLLSILILGAIGAAIIVIVISLLVGRE
jgi:hypothetical protein